MHSTYMMIGVWFVNEVWSCDGRNMSFFFFFLFFFFVVMPLCCGGVNHVQLIPTKLRWGPSLCELRSPPSATSQRHFGGFTISVLVFPFSFLDRWRRVRLHFPKPVGPDMGFVLLIWEDNFVPSFFFFNNNTNTWNQMGNFWHHQQRNIP